MLRRILGAAYEMDPKGSGCSGRELPRAATKERGG